MVPQTVAADGGRVPDERMIEPAGAVSSTYVPFEVCGLSSASSKSRRPLNSEVCAVLAEADFARDARCRLQPRRYEGKSMVSGITYKQAKLADDWDAIVIGSGIGGLTAAVLLAVNGGKRVLVLERHYEVGGFTH